VRDEIGEGHFTGHAQPWLVISPSLEDTRTVTLVGEPVQ
jgi:hypothetical protein